MIDHVGIEVSDYDRSKAFYEPVLATIGMTLLMEPAEYIGGFGFPDQGKPFFWIGTRTEPTTSAHVAFSAGSREIVDEFHKAAMAAGGTDNGGPGRARDLPPALLRRLRAGPGRQQHRSRLPRAGLTHG